MYKLTPQQITAITDELNQARCLEKKPVWNLELTRRLVMAIESSPESQPPAARSELDELGMAIERALLLCPGDEVLSVITGTFVILTTAMLRRAGHDPDRKIRIDGGNQRDITIHAKK